MKPFVIFLGLVCLVSGISCKSNEEVNCLDILSPEFISFKIADKNTNADLFFGAQPAYITGELKIYQHDKLIPFEIKTDAANGSYFKVQVQIAYTNAETLQLKIADEPLQELIYTSTTASDPCPRYPVNTVKFNSINYDNVLNRVIVLKK